MSVLPGPHAAFPTDTPGSRCAAVEYALRTPRTTAADRGRAREDDIIEPRQRRAAVIATATAIPLTVLLAFVFSAGHSGSGTNTSAASSAAAASATVTISAPPSPTAAIAKACTTVIAGLPVQLAGLDARKYDSNSSFVAAWGQPAVVLRCGVTRVNPNDPSKPQPQDVIYGKQAADNVNWLVDSTKNQVVYTTIDRGNLVVEVTVPQSQVQNASGVLISVSQAVGQLPATCSTTGGDGTKSSNTPTCDGTN